jgi:hypothetical protein
MREVPRQLRSHAERLARLAERMRANERTFSEDDFDRLPVLVAELFAMADRAELALPQYDGDDDANDASELTRPCTCVGECRGAAGLGQGWICMVDHIRRGGLAGGTVEPARCAPCAGRAAGPCEGGRCACPCRYGAPAGDASNGR